MNKCNVLITPSGTQVEINSNIGSYVGGNNSERWINMQVHIKNDIFDMYQSGESITSSELEIIANNIKLLLDNKITEKNVINTLEMVNSFIFYEDHMEINLNNNNEYYSLYLDKENVNALYNYFSKILDKHKEDIESE